jgi:ribosome-associated toxin RatA of RatAB toxin-antitoxin module
MDLVADFGMEYLGRGDRKQCGNTNFSLGDPITMVIINDLRDVSAPLNRVWDIIADVDNDPKYWPNPHTVDNISKDGNVIEREVTVGFRKSKSRQTILLNPKKSVEMTMTEGPVNSTRVITLIPLDADNNNNKTKIDISWNIELSSVPILGRSIVKNNLANDTKEALSRIAKVVQ